MTREKPDRRLLKRAAMPALLVGALGFGGALALLNSPGFRAELFGEEPEPEMPGPESLALRRGLLALRDEAAARDDLATVARTHARLVSEATLRADAVYDAWMPLRNPDTTLFPQSTEKSQWNYRNVAADFFCFQLHTGLYTQSEDVDLLFDTLEREASLGDKGELPLPRWVGDGSVVLGSSEHPTFGSRGPLFGASEYVKDGLLSLYEATGDRRVYDRMLRVVDAIIAHSRHATRFGAIPSESSEVNGEMLQTLARIARVESDPRYADMLGRIADAATEIMLPANYGMPAHTFNYESGEAGKAKVPLRDHGNEIIPGLAEAFAYAVDHAGDEAWRARAERWAEPLARMFEGVLRAGVREDGLPINALNARTLEVLDPGVNDNWGYVSVGALLFAERAETSGLLAPDRCEAIRESVRALARAVATTDRMHWEGAEHDGFADSIESAMLIASHDAQASDMLSAWIDDQIGVMFAMQRPSGFVSGGYLDGNFMRTALMYADKRSGGWVLHPWDESTSVGHASDDDGRSVLVVTGRPGATYTLAHRATGQGFRGVFQRPTPRLNAWPVWTDPGAKVEGATQTDPPPPGGEDALRQVTIPAGGIGVLELHDPGPASGE